MILPDAPDRRAVVHAFGCVAYHARLLPCTFAARNPDAARPFRSPRLDDRQHPARRACRERSRAALPGHVATPADGLGRVAHGARADAHEDDPLANLRLKEADFAWATEKLVDIAEKQSGGRIVSMLEGGYNLTALARSVAVHLNRLMLA